MLGDGGGADQVDLTGTGPGSLDLAGGSGQEPEFAALQEQANRDEFEEQRFEQLLLPFEDCVDLVHPTDSIGAFPAPSSVRHPHFMRRAPPTPVRGPRRSTAGAPKTARPHWAER